MKKPAQSIGARSTWMYVASLVEIAVATDILTEAWTQKEYLALTIPLALALAGVAASVAGKRGALLGTAALCVLLLIWRYGHTQALTGRDLLGITLFGVTALILGGLALSRRQLESQIELREEEARQAWQREAELNRAKDDFLSLVAHELRNPVSIIVGCVDLLERNIATDGAREQLIHDLSTESRRLHHLIEDLLALARLDTGFRPIPEPILLQRLVPKIVAEFHERFKNEVGMNLDPDLPLASGSTVQVERVLSNVLENAGKYSPATAPINIEAHQLEGQVKIDVLDSGRGVPPEARELIFDRFYRSEPSEDIRGYGLGLAISKRLVEANRGQIWARNREGGGLDIGFSLPLYRE